MSNFFYVTEKGRGDHGSDEMGESTGRKSQKKGVGCSRGGEAVSKAGVSGGKAEVL